MTFVGTVKYAVTDENRAYGVWACINSSSHDFLLFLPVPVAIWEMNSFKLFLFFLCVIFCIDRCILGYVSDILRYFILKIGN